MTKEHFLKRLRHCLAGLPSKDVEDRLTFYSEIIDDKMEDGLSEEQAVRGIGSADFIAAQIIRDTPLKDIAKERFKPKEGTRVWIILFLVLGSPIWLSLLIAGFALFVSLYILLWTLIVSVWTVFGSLAVFAAGTAFGGVFFFMSSSPISALAALGMSAFSAGLSILFFYLSLAFSKVGFGFTRWVTYKLKNSIRKKEVA